jgi:uncharacterized protein with NRDE domain
MCISLLSTEHPNYPFILLSNRDEHLDRPTARAQWWHEPDQHVLGGRDLLRDVRGTWLAITRDGRLANLTNFRDEGAEIMREGSRGGIANAYVLPSPSMDPDDEGFVQKLLADGIHNVGGFTLMFGRLRRPTVDGKMPGLSVISNRTASADETQRICTRRGETNGLSNSHYGDWTWPKVVHGERFLKQAIEASVSRNGGKEELIERLFAVLSIDTLPKRTADEDFETFARQLRNSIFIPVVGGERVGGQSAETAAAMENGTSLQKEEGRGGKGRYGTQRQTVILVDGDGEVTFVERTLYEGTYGSAVKEDDRERRFTFRIDGWEA